MMVDRGVAALLLWEMFGKQRRFKLGEIVRFVPLKISRQKMLKV